MKRDELNIILQAAGDQFVYMIDNDWLREIFIEELSYRLENRDDLTIEDAAINSSESAK